MRRAAVSRSWYRPEGPSGGPLVWCSLVGVPRSPTHQRGCKHTSAALQNRAPAARQAQRGSSDEEMETFMFGGRTKGDMNRGAAVPGARTRRSRLAPCGSARKSSWWAVLGAWWYKKGAAGFPRLSQQEIYGRGLTLSHNSAFPICAPTFVAKGVSEKQNFLSRLPPRVAHPL